MGKLEAKVQEQEVILRRVLNLMIEWLENGDAPPQRQQARRSDAA